MTRLAQKNLFAGRYLKYPDLGLERIAEGGLRTESHPKLGEQHHPLVSVITVSLNAAATIEQALESVRSQSYTHIEQIVIDGGSTDGTVDVLKNSASSIDYFISEKDRGLYHAINKGVQLASGDYILVLNADDWYQADAVEKLLNARKNGNTDFACALAQYVHEDGTNHYLLENMAFNAQVRLRMPLRHELMLLSKHIYNDVGPYSEDYKIASDLDFAIRLYERGYQCTVLEEPLLFFRTSGISHRDDQRLLRDRALLIGQQFPFLKEGEVDILSRNNLNPEEMSNLARKYPSATALCESIADLSNRLFPLE